MKQYEVFELQFTAPAAAGSWVDVDLSAFPNVWWSLANEYDLLSDFEDDWWFRFAARWRWTGTAVS